ncbi:MAG: hypothetical protein IJ832_07105, partial [Bacteroidaceae bacterium]|nr:hypothetical protein [Bacteroidaceae bacterium]
CISSFPIGDPGTTADEQFAQENIARRATSLSKRTLLEEQLLAMPPALPLRSHCSLISALASPTADEQFAMPSAFVSYKEWLMKLSIKIK